jgi:hypothetical protein
MYYFDIDITGQDSDIVHRKMRLLRCPIKAIIQLLLLFKANILAIESIFFQVIHKFFSHNHPDWKLSDQMDSFEAPRRRLGSLYTISAFCPSLAVPRPLPPPPSPKLSYSNFQGPLEDWDIETLRATYNEAGTVNVGQMNGNTSISLSTYLREHKWTANKPLNIPEGEKIKDGNGFLGYGGSKVSTFVSSCIDTMT